jgi:hypothetical protein
MYRLGDGQWGPVSSRSYTETQCNTVVTIYTIDKIESFRISSTTSNGKMIMNNKIRNDVETNGTDLFVSTMQILTDGADECLEKLRFQIKPENFRVQNCTADSPAVQSVPQRKHRTSPLQRSTG